MRFSARFSASPTRFRSTRCDSNHRVSEQRSTVQQSASRGLFECDPATGRTPLDFLVQKNQHDFDATDAQRDERRKRSPALAGSSCRRAGRARRSRAVRSPTRSAVVSSWVFHVEPGWSANVAPDSLPIARASGSRSKTPESRRKPRAAFSLRSPDGRTFKSLDAFITKARASRGESAAVVSKSSRSGAIVSAEQPADKDRARRPAPEHRAAPSPLALQRSSARRRIALTRSPFADCAHPFALRVLPSRSGALGAPRA